MPSCSTILAIPRTPVPVNKVSSISTLRTLGECFESSYSLPETRFTNGLSVLSLRSAFSFSSSRGPLLVRSKRLYSLLLCSSAGLDGVPPIIDVSIFSLLSLIVEVLPLFLPPIAEAPPPRNAWWGENLFLCIGCCLGVWQVAATRSGGLTPELRCSC